MEGISSIGSRHICCYKKFPRDELFGLTSQMRRAAVSVTSNIAEGFGRRSYKEKVQFFYQSQGSLTEIKNQLLLSRDISYIDNTTYERLTKQARISHQLLQGLITKLKSFFKRS